MSLKAALLLGALCACAHLAAAQAPAPAPYVDPNPPAESFQAILKPIEQTNPLGLTAAQVQSEGQPLPQGAITFVSQLNTDQSIDPEGLWSWSYIAYNVENIGLTTVHNIKDPSWPVVYKLFDSASSPQLVPDASGEVNVTDLDTIAQGLMDGNGVELGYTGILEAVNDTALAIVSRMADDPTGTQAIYGTLFSGNEGAPDLVGSGELPTDPEAVPELTPEEIANLPPPDSLLPEARRRMRMVLRRLLG